MVLTLHTTHSGNAADIGVYAAGVEALNAAGDNSDIRSVVVVGTGNTFSAGLDLQRWMDNRSALVKMQADRLDAFHLFIETLHTFPKPILAAVEGSAVGAGFSLALACDMIVAARDAVFSFPNGDVGLTPDGGATWHLARSLPRGTAIEIALLGEEVAAERLHALGIVNRLSQPGSALHDALLLTETLNARAPNVIAATKELLAASPHASLTKHLGSERQQLLESLEHANAGIGIDAYASKRRPLFN